MQDHPDAGEGRGGAAEQAGIVDQQDAVLEEIERHRDEQHDTGEVVAARIVDPADDIYD